MGVLDDSALFAAVIKHGGFSHAAKHLGLSNGMVSRRIAQLEQKLGVSLIKRTTRQFVLTPEGELFYTHAQRIQQELDSALLLIHASANKPKGCIRISAPTYFGRHYLAPIILKFLTHFPDIHIDLVLNNHVIDPIKEQIDLAIRSVGFLSLSAFKESSLHMKLLCKERIGLYASVDYLQKYGEPHNTAQLAGHRLISYSNGDTQQQWTFSYEETSEVISIAPQFKSNDIECNLAACISGYGIGRFTDLHVKKALGAQLIEPILKQCNWGEYGLYFIYAHQQSLPKRCRLLLEFIQAQIQHLL